MLHVEHSRLTQHASVETTRRDYANSKILPLGDASPVEMLHVEQFPDRSPRKMLHVEQIQKWRALHADREASIDTESVSP